MCNADENLLSTKKITTMPLTTAAKVECLNPNTGRRMNINKDTYKLFSKAILKTLKEKGAITFTEIVNGVYDCFKKQKTTFDGAVEWYTVSVKNDLHARGVIDVYTEKGKKLHCLKK
jgi:hypothetical protein